MDEPGLDPDDPRPPFRQVAERLRQRIGSGEFAPGAKLPGRSTLCADYGVAVRRG